MARTAHRVYPVSVELLRKGPPHNQLLSQITDYVALCGNLGAEPVHLPFNHLEHEMRLERLSYVDAAARDETRRYTLDEMAASMTTILEQIPGLAPALSQAFENRTDITHLRMVLTPHELALIPFETANVPKGAPGGAGSKLLLQSASPVTLTREVRGVTAIDTTWPRQPRVLFAWAAPDGVGSIPYEDHLRAIRRSLSLWLAPYQPRGSSEPDKELEMERQHFVRETKARLTLLPNATIKDIYDACEKTPFTHVHILAHGVPKDYVVGQKSVGVALHDIESATSMDIVDGARLANALRFRDKEKGELPAMVVLATCDSARQRSVITHGGSIAHDLHVAGIPVVIASQFPLSKVGSTVLAGELYRRVFEGDDPRVAMYYVRRKLFSTLERYHDWASLVMYAGLPRNFETQLAALQYDVAKKRIDSLLNAADRLISRPHSASASPTTGLKPPEEARDELRKILYELDGAAQDLRDRGDDTPETVGMVASTKKRKAEALFRASQFSDVVDSTRRDYLSRSLVSLSESRDVYLQAMRMNLSWHWVGVQYLSLSAVLRAAHGPGKDDPAEEVWTAVYHAATSKLTDPDRTERAYAHASLAELYLLRGIGRAGGPDVQDRQLGEEHARKMTELVPLESFAVYSTRRQFRRYVDWWQFDLNPHRTPSGLATYGFPEALLSVM
jgi:hypothetical protein